MKSLSFQHTQLAVLVHGLLLPHLEPLGLIWQKILVVCCGRHDCGCMSLEFVVESPRYRTVVLVFIRDVSAM